jgi:hypothetical protein
MVAAAERAGVVLMVASPAFLDGMPRPAERALVAKALECTARPPCQISAPTTRCSGPNSPCRLTPGRDAIADIKLVGDIVRTYLQRDGFQKGEV